MAAAVEPEEGEGAQYTCAGSPLHECHISVLPWGWAGLEPGLQWVAPAPLQMPAQLCSPSQPV